MSWHHGRNSTLWGSDNSGLSTHKKFRDLLDNLTKTHSVASYTLLFRTNILFIPGFTHMTDVFEDSEHKSKEKSDSEIPRPLKKQYSLPNDMMPSSSRLEDVALENAPQTFGSVTQSSPEVCWCADAIDLDAVTTTEGAHRAKLGRWTRSTSQAGSMLKITSELVSPVNYPGRPWSIPTYSASAADRAIVYCFYAHQLTGPVKTKPLTQEPSSWQPHEASQ